MKISTLIEKSLFDDKKGYYKTKNPIGKNADFITAPEISQIFGELVAVYLLHIAFNSQNKISLVEMGAGRGTWFKDILQTINKLAQKNNPQALDFLGKAQFHIIEINPVLQKTQQQNLQNFTIKWHKNFADFLEHKNGEIFFISNELFDCFAIDQYVNTAEGWCERLVKFDDEKTFKNPQFFLEKFNVKTQNFVEEKLGNFLTQNAPINAIFEYSKTAQKFMKKLCEAIKKAGGMVINFDYGYSEYEFANTLQAIKNHQKIPFLEGLSDSDITAHVDFLALDKIVKNFELDSSLVTQEEFLLSLGAQQRVDFLLEKNPHLSQKIASEFSRLIAKNQMGKLFKSHIFWKK
jgi:SAM-dependent MidA family methyltransferase